ncbi:large ribosomal subunit protein eL20y isoform X2 [Cannabis sativa]|uniref:large ribosomal subunit protein eL20y isoform X2 n=1 Tax=Cannabis sativa TaxID=3483 RepID=UPI0029CA20AD|nr:large ribosomal subunit protein eL20y isoform X2 [Cannabis sativa]
MSEQDSKTRGIGIDPESQYYYGTFQGVANSYPPPQPSHPVFGFPPPLPPPAATASTSHPRYPHTHYNHGYQTVPGIAIVEGHPIREHRLPCCGLGMGWFLFLIGFFFGGIPWYVGAFVLLFVRVDYREKPGYAACTIAFHQYQVVGRALPTESDDHPKIYRMKLWATNEVRAKSKFWYFLRKLKKVKKSNGQVLAINEIFEKNPTTIKNFGIWLRYQSRTGYHNMYKEYRDTTLNGAVEQMYTEMASRHRVRFPCIQIIKTATIPAKLCKREITKQFHNSKIKFPLVFKKVRPPTRKLKTTYKATRPNLFM